MGTNLALTLIACGVAVSGAAAGQDRAGDAMHRFGEAVASYAALHRDVERRLPPLDVSGEAWNIFHAADARAEAIRAARPTARVGDIFNAEAGTLLRARIRATLLARGHDPAEILAFMLEYDGEPVPGETRPAVNGRFSWSWPSFMVPCLFEVLPALPPELEYRFVERDLILIDIDANLVVDILEDAFPVITYR